MIDEAAFGLIKMVNGYYGRTALNVDEKRQTKRRGYKKSKPTNVSSAHINALLDLLSKHDDYESRRDMLLVCLLVYQGLRCSEVHDLEVQNVDLHEGTFKMYRRKVDKTQTHAMHARTLIAMQRYLAVAQPRKLLFEGVDRKEWSNAKGETRKGHSRYDGLATKSINERIGYLGLQVQVKDLSPHDLRHKYTTDLFKKKTPLDVVMQAGGWKSYKMPLEYRNESAIANEGVIQSE